MDQIAQRGSEDSIPGSKVQGQTGQGFDLVKDQYREAGQDDL